METAVLLKTAQELATQEVQIRLLEDQEQILQQALGTCKVRSARKQLQIDLKVLSKNIDLLKRQAEKLKKQADSIRKTDAKYQGKQFWWDIPFQNARQDEGFVFPEGFYTEQNLLELSYEKEWKITQRPIKKIMLLLDLYKRASDKYIILYQNPNKPMFSLSKELDVKYIYNMMSLSNTHRVISHIKTGYSPAAMVWMQYREQKEVLEQKKKANLQEFDRKADNYERYFYDDYKTAAERYARGELSLQAYQEQSRLRNYYRDEIKMKYDSQTAGLARQAEYITNQSLEHFDTTRKDATESHEKVRFIPVAEVIYLDGELMMIAAYKTPQEITEIECKEKMNLYHLEGALYAEDTLMEGTPSYTSLISHIVQVYSSKMGTYSVLDERPVNCPDEIWRIWAEVRWAFELSKI